MENERTIGARDRLIHTVLDIINNRKPNSRNLFVAEGIWAHRQVLASRVPVEIFLVCPELIYSDIGRSLARTFSRIAMQRYRVSSKAITRLSDRKRPDGFISVCRMPFRSLEDIVVRRNSIVVVIDGLEIPGNVGAIIRTADGAGGSGVIVCSRRARLTHPKVIRASHGTCFRVPVVECTVKEAFGWLEANHFDVFLVDANQGIPYYTACYETQTAFVLGNEKYGISPEWYRLTESRISVPMNGSADSLNVAVAGAIVIYDAWVKIQSNMAYIRHISK